MCRCNFGYSTNDFFFCEWYFSRDCHCEWSECAREQLRPRNKTKSHTVYMHIFTRTTQFARFDFSTILATVQTLFTFICCCMLIFAEKSAKKKGAPPPTTTKVITKTEGNNNAKKIQENHMHNESDKRECCKSIEKANAKGSLVRCGCHWKMSTLTTRSFHSTQKN